MTLQEAIKILSGTRPASFESDADDLVKALKLGIEALKRLQVNRRWTRGKLVDLLLGETTE